MAEHPRGPRDWEPSDPNSQWWNPRPGDAYGPSDQEYRQPWERPAPIRRFQGDQVVGPPPVPVPGERAAPERISVVPPPPVPRPSWQRSPWYGLLGGLTLLAVAVAMVGGGIAIFIGSWRTPALGLVAVALAAVVELAILAAAAALSYAWPRSARSIEWRIGVPVIVVAALAPTPVGLALILRDERWSQGGWLAVMGIAIALIIRRAATPLRRVAWPVPSPLDEPEQTKAENVATLLRYLAILVFVVGCGCLVVPAGVRQFVEDPLAGAGEPITGPAPAIPTPSWSPPTTDGGGGADPAATIRHDLESRVLRSAGVPGSVTSECLHAFEQPDFVCTVTYQGLDVQFAVQTRAGGGDSYGHEAEASETVLTRRGLHAQLREQFGDYRELRCDELPGAWLVRVDEQLELRCYGKPSLRDSIEEIGIIPRQPGEPPTFVRGPD